MAFVPPPPGFMPHGEYVAGHWSRRTHMTQPTYYLGNYSAAKFEAEARENQACRAQWEQRQRVNSKLVVLGFNRTWTPEETNFRADLTGRIIHAVRTNADWFTSEWNEETKKPRLMRGGRLCTKTGKYLPSRCLRRNKSSKRGNTMPLSTFTGYYGDVKFLKRIVMAEFCNLYNIHEDYHD